MEMLLFKVKKKKKECVQENKVKKGNRAVMWVRTGNTYFHTVMMHSCLSGCARNSLGRR